MEISTKQGNEADDKPEFIRVRVRGGGQGWTRPEEEGIELQDSWSGLATDQKDNPHILSTEQMESEEKSHLMVTNDKGQWLTSH